MRRARRLRDEEGLAAMTGVMIVVLLVAVAGIGVGVGGLVAVHRRAAAAADLAALAAASAQQRGGDPCLIAESIARANGASLTECVVDGMSVEVSVRITSDGLLRGSEVRGRARAGPAE